MICLRSRSSAHRLAGSVPRTSNARQWPANNAVMLSKAGLESLATSAPRAFAALAWRMGARAGDARRGAARAALSHPVGVGVGTQDDQPGVAKSGSASTRAPCALPGVIAPSAVPMPSTGFSGFAHRPNPPARPLGALATFPCAL